MRLWQDSLTTFCQEMLESTDGDRLLKELSAELVTPSLPSLEKTRQGYDFVSKLHGISFNHEGQEVTISYRVIGELYESVTVPFIVFSLILQGLEVKRRHLKWQFK